MTTRAVFGFVAVFIILPYLSAEAKDVKSPDGRYAVRAEQTITLVDLATGELILTLVGDTSGDAKIEVAWSPDSKHLFVVESSDRGSGIVGAWKDQAWHKTLELDQDLAAFIHKEQLQSQGRLVSEHRKLAGWLNPAAVAVKGAIVFSNGTKHDYGYTLAFKPGPGRLDRGGYEEGQLVAKDYHN